MPVSVCALPACMEMTSKNLLAPEPSISENTQSLTEHALSLFSKKGLFSPTHFVRGHKTERTILTTKGSECNSL